MLSEKLSKKVREQLYKDYSGADNEVLRKIIVQSLLSRFEYLEKNLKDSSLPIPVNFQLPKPGEENQYRSN